MSYILDALKKSQTNDQDDGMAVRIDPVQQKSGISPIWAWLLGGLLALNLVAVIWYFGQTDTVANENTAQQLEAEHVPSEQVEVTEPIVEEPASEPPVTLVVESQPAVPKTKPIRELGLADLPTADRTRIAAFSYTSHIYTEDPEFRAVVIDGQRLRTGETFQDLQIHAITEFGLVFESVQDQEIWRIAVNPFQ